MKTWITADWHLGETRFELMGRPFTSQQEMIDILVNNHNALVKEDDEVIMAGDVCYSNAPECLDQVSRFNGRKTLIRGNHDRVFTDEQLSPYFVSIIAEGKGILVQLPNEKFVYVTHYPTEGKHNYFNLVGHVHGAWKIQLNMYNIGVDVHHFCPVNIDTVPFHMTAIEKYYYDEDVWVGYQEINSRFRNIRGKPGTYFRPEVLGQLNKVTLP